MSNHTRRALLKTGLAMGAWGVAGFPEFALPALAQGDEVIPFTDYPETFRTTVSATNRFLDIRTIDGPFTPKDQFFTTQHYGHPVVDAATFRLKVGGLVNKPLALSLDELKKMGETELWFGFECSGNSARPMQGLSSNGRWTGVPLRNVLNAAGLKADGHEVVFFGADKGMEKVEFRTTSFDVEQQYGRSLTREEALAAEPMLAWALNGEPLTLHQGSPLRLLVPGWYGVANVKWLAQIQVQQERYLGKYQARWYRTLRGETIDGETKWVEKAVTRQNLKSVVARVTKRGTAATVHGFVLNDGTPLKSVEVKIDEGQWQPATLDPVTAKHKYSWKLFTYTWNNPTPGDHTIVSRATDANGVVQPTTEQLVNKKTFLEDNSQMVRKVRVG